MCPAGGKCTDRGRLIVAFTIGLNQGAVMQARLEEFLAGCGAHGFSEVELRVPKMIEALYHLGLEEFRRLLDDNGVRVTAVNSMDDFALVPDDHLGILEREAETVRDLCVAARCDLVVAPLGRWFADREPEWPWVVDRSASRLERIAKILGAEGIRVGLEPIGFPRFTVWSLEGAMEIAEASGISDAVLVADVYNLMRGRSDVESMRRYGSAIGLIHVNDSLHRDYDALDVMYTRSFPGEGVLNPGEWVRSAVAGGFDGAVSMEMFPRDVWDMDIGDALGYCRTKADAFAETLNFLEPERNHRARR